MIFIPTVYAAKDPVRGIAVYLSSEGWVADITSAEVAMDPDENVILAALGRAGERAGHVADVHALAVRLVDGRPSPIAIDLAVVTSASEARVAKLHPLSGGDAAPRLDGERAA